MVSGQSYAGAVATNVPVGSIMPWLKSYTNTPALADGWVECDGAAISDGASPFNGQNAPDLQSTKVMLRSSTTSGTTGGSDTHVHITFNNPDLNTTTGYQSDGTTATSDLSAASYGAGGGEATRLNVNQPNPTYTDVQSSLPAYYEVVYIMRIK